MDKNTTIRLRSGNEIPIIGLGTWQLTNDTPGTIAYALELGYPISIRLAITALSLGLLKALKSQVPPEMIFI